MNLPPLVLWILGPIGAGKSTLLCNGDCPDWRIVDQDAPLEAAMRECGLPLDTRTHTPAQAAEFASLRAFVSAKLWNQVARWREERVSLVIQTTGNKPYLMKIEVDAFNDAGYINLGVGLRCPLATCLSRNLHRTRVLPEAVVQSTWNEFERNLSAKTFESLLGAERVVIMSIDQPVDVVRWARRIMQRDTTVH